MKPLPLRTHGRPAGCDGARNLRTNGERLARRRDQIADMWSGRHDGRLWTAEEIALEIGIETEMVFRHLQWLRREGDARAFRDPAIKNHRRTSPIRLIATRNEP